MTITIAVGLSVLEEIKSSLPNTTVALLTGELQQIWQGDEQYQTDNQGIEDILNADIVITTIDQIAKWLTTNRENTYFSEFIKRYAVFDEYHELFAIPSLYYISAILMRLKERQRQAHLFISATPEPMHLRLVCRQDASWKEPIILPSFNAKPVNVSFIETLPKHEKGAIYIFNTATKAQQYALSAWSAGQHDINCYHSKYKPIDKQDLTQSILSMFGKDTSSVDATLDAGPIAQASLNISRRIENTEATHPANLVQRIGRSNRFAEYASAEVRILVSDEQITEKKGKYGTWGAIKNTGIRKLIFKENRVVVHPNENYYASYSFDFYQELIRKFAQLKNKPAQLANCKFSVKLNDLNDFYLSFQLTQISKGGKLVSETKAFVSDAMRYLETVELYKPSKLTVETEKGKEVRVSFRGGSLWATMCEVSILPDMKIDEIDSLIALPSDRQNLVTVIDADQSEIDFLSNLNALCQPEFKALKSSLRYRAKYSGSSQIQHLIRLAKSADNPLVCSVPSLHTKTGLYYLKAQNSNGNWLTLGFMRLKNGTKSIK